MAILIVEKLRGKNRGKYCGRKCVRVEAVLTMNAACHMLRVCYKRKYVHVMYSLQLTLHD